MKKTVFLTASLSYGLIGIFIYITNVVLDKSFQVLSLGTTLLGFLSCLALLPGLAHRQQGEPKPFLPQLIKLFFHQSLPILVCYLVLLGIQQNGLYRPEAFPLQPEHFAQAFLGQPLLTFFSPMLLSLTLSLLSLLTAEHTQQAVWLPSLSFGLSNKHPRCFFIVAYHDVLNIGLLALGSVLCTLMALFLSSIFTESGLISSPFRFSIRTALFLFIVLIVSGKQRTRFIKQILKRKLSLGHLLLFMGFILGLSLVALQLFVDFAPFPLPERHLPQAHASGNEESLAFIQGLQAICIALQLFFVPYFIRVFQSLFQGRRVVNCLLQGLLFPSLLCAVLVYCPTDVFQSRFFDTLSRTQLLLALILSFTLLLILFGKVHAIFDLQLKNAPDNMPFKNYSLGVFAKLLVQNTLHNLAIFFLFGWLIWHFIFYGVSLCLLSLFGLSTLMLGWRLYRQIFFKAKSKNLSATVI